MCGKIDCYIESFSRLKPIAGIAKPILLLAVLDLIEAKKINREFIELSQDLADAYAGYRQRVKGNNKTPEMAVPFYFLDEEPFWHLVLQPCISPPTETIVSVEQLKEHYLGARIDSELFKLCLMEPLRRRLRDVLTETYFSKEYFLNISEN